MKKRILRNWGLKLTSPVIAFMLWFLVMSTNNPKDTQTYANIPVTLKNIELLEQENKVYEVLDNTDVVRVSVRAPRNVFSQLRASDIVAEADVSKLTDINTIAITCTVPNFEVESVTANPTVVRLNIEEKSSHWIDVKSFTSGDVAEGYVIVNTSADQSRIQVSGPKSQVDAISYAGLRMDVSGATSTQYTNAEVILYDAEGRPIESAGIEKSSNYIRMEVEILPTREVPVELNVSGEPAEGFLATGVTECTIDKVVVAGSAAVLANFKMISIPAEQLDITGAVGNVETVVNLREYLPLGVRFADSSFNSRATITVYVEPEIKRTVPIPQEKIRVNGLADHLDFRYPIPDQNYRLIVSGLGMDVSAMTLEDISCTVDVEKWMKEQNISRLLPGTYEFPVDVAFTADSALAGKIKMENEISVRLIIEEVEEE